MQALILAERDVLLWIQEHLRCAALDPVMKFLSTIGNSGAFWIALTVALLIFRRTRRVGACCAGAMILTFLVVNCALKPLVARVRPYDLFQEISILVRPERDFSFPSGHSASSFACAWALFRASPRKYGAPALALAGLIALSRLYVGVHYPTDVLAGVALGILLAELALRLIRRLRDLRLARCHEGDSGQK